IHGRMYIFSDAAMQCCIMIKFLFRLSFGMVTGFVHSLFHLCGLYWIAPDFTTICRRRQLIDIVSSYQICWEGVEGMVESAGLEFCG
ncbi:transposase, partial [Acinetobacter baumannii]